MAGSVSSFFIWMASSMGHYPGAGRGRVGILASSAGRLCPYSLGRSSESGEIIGECLWGCKSILLLKHLPKRALCEQRAASLACAWLSVAAVAELETAIKAKLPQFEPWRRR